MFRKRFWVSPLFPCLYQRFTGRALSTSTPSSFDWDKWNPPRASPPTPSSQTKIVSDVCSEGDFKRTVLESKVPVILECCPESSPLQEFDQTLEREIKDLNGIVVMARFKTNPKSQLHEALGIKTLPSIHLINHGKLIEQFTGFLGENEVKQLICKAVRLARETNTAPPDRIMQDLILMENILGGIMAILKVQCSPSWRENATICSVKDLEDTSKALHLIANFTLEELPENVGQNQRRRLEEELATRIRAVAHAGLVRLALLREDHVSVQDIVRRILRDFPESVLEHFEVRSALALVSSSQEIA